LVALMSNGYSQNLPLSIKKQFLNKNKQSLEDTLNKRIVYDHPFVLGRYYTPVADKINHPFYGENEWANGSLVFKGKTYPVEGLKYDIEKDKLIYLMYSSSGDMVGAMTGVALDENFISGFKILNRSFRFYKGLSTNWGFKKDAGYYEVAYDGKLKFLIRKKKSLSVNDNSTQMKYDETVRMFLLKNGKLTRIFSMSTLKNQLKDKKSKVNAFVRDNHLRLGQSDYSSASQLLNFYESLDK
jgi:hypothetical protein